MAIASLRPIPRIAGACLLAAALAPAAFADAPRAHREGTYAVTPLVSDGAVTARFDDPNLKNGWGVAFNPTAFVWVAANGTGKATLYDGSGKPQSLVVSVPGAPTGIVFSGSADFVVRRSGLAGPARFLFASEDGTISGWAPNVDLNNAIVAVDNGAAGSSYKGLALAGDGTGNFLYAADFHHGRVDIFDASFQPVHRPGAFVDPQLPAGYAPFGIQNLQGNLYVTYARQDADAHDEIAGRGFGFVDVYDAAGRLIRRVASGGALNAPWGLALAPAEAASPPTTCAPATSSASCAGTTGGAWRCRACGAWPSATACSASRAARCSSPPGRTTRPTGSTAASTRCPAAPRTSATTTEAATNGSCAGLGFATPERRPEAAGLPGRSE